MNVKEFISDLSARLDKSQKETALLVESLISNMTVELEEGNILNIQDFGTFEVKKKAERISVNPSTRQRMLVPPKLTLSFKPHNKLKEKFK